MHTNWIQDTQALLNSKEESTPTRRLALQTALGLGYAAAAMPLIAQTAIQTSGEGLIEGEVTIDVNGFKLPAVRKQPRAGTAQVPRKCLLSAMVPYVHKAPQPFWL